MIYGHNQMRAWEEVDGFILLCLAVTGGGGKFYPNSNSDRIQDAGLPAPTGESEQREGSWECG